MLNSLRWLKVWSMNWLALCNQSPFVFSRLPIYGLQAAMMKNDIESRQSVPT